MPWSGKADVARHNKAAAKSPGAAKQWTTVANKILGESGGDDGKAIRIANAAVAKRKGKAARRNTILER